VTVTWKIAIVSIGDALLGWTLDLPRDAALLVIAAGTACVLVVLRRWFADQGLLRQSVVDSRRLAELMRTAKQQGDSEAKRRIRRRRALVAQVRMKQEVKPALLSLVPLVLLAFWMAARFEFLPPTPGDPVRFEAQLPVTEGAQIIHLVPISGLATDDGWVRTIDRQHLDDRSEVSACWTLRAVASDALYRLTVRAGDTTVEHPLLVGQPHYLRPNVTHPQGWETLVRLERYTPFGFVPQLGRLPAWLLAYLVLSITCFYVLKRVFRVA
jgi:uncharacterized membrane protein (DUF106 family)